MIRDTNGLKWPETPEERESIPDYGDLVSTIIWFPIRTLSGLIRCENCHDGIESHDIPGTGACNP